MKLGAQIILGLFGLAFTGGLAWLVADALGGEGVSAGVSAAVTAVAMSLMALRDKPSEDFCVKGVRADGTVGFVWVTGRFDPLKPATVTERQPERHVRNGFVVEEPAPPRAPRRN